METGATSAEEAGKWLIFLAPEEVDTAWQKVRNATVAGTLGIGAKVSTAKKNEDSRDDRKVSMYSLPTGQTKKTSCVCVKS